MYQIFTLWYLEALNMVMNLLRKLGFHINWKKVTDPCTKIRVFGYWNWLIEHVSAIARW